MIPHRPLTPAQHPLTPAQHRLLWWSSFLSLLSMAPIVDPMVRVGLPLLFIVLTRRSWSKLATLAWFAGLISLMLVQSGGLNKEVGTAILMSTMLAKALDMRTRRDASVMVLFNIMAPFVAFLQDQTPIIFGLGALALGSTLVLSQAITEHHLGNTGQVCVRAIKSMMLQSIMVLPLVALAYLIVPRLDNPLWGGYGHRQGPNISENMDVSHWKEMFNDLSTAFRVRFQGRPPPPSAMYFRGITLWNFDGSVWTTQPSNPAAFVAYAPPRGIVGGKPAYRYTVSYEPGTTRHLYALDYPTIIPPGVMVSSDDQVWISPSAPLANSVSWTSAPGRFAPLTTAERQSALQLPIGRNPRVLALAKQWRQDHPDDRDFANFVMNYIKKGGYAYSFDPPPVGRESVDDFFLDTKVGFCAHYSSAFTVIMRAAGIPARVVGGYVASEVSELGDYYRVRHADAHAWSEVWLDDHWERFDPTAQVDARREHNTLSWSFLNSSYDMGDWMKDSWNRWVLFYDDASQEKVMEDIKASWHDFHAPTWLAWGKGIPVLLIVGAGGWWWWRRPRSSLAHALMRSIDAWFVQCGVSCPPGTSWTSKAHLVSKTWPAAERQHLFDVIKQAQSHCYGRQPLSPAEVRSLVEQLNTIRSVMARRKGL